ncbi:isopenicillin-N N-acyltransferase-like protein [Neorhizobium galegae]|uniref:C45 family autoproteolytic acyltransferase/hydolase n=1 Tax=Neorhizobium galegae TaxID=399 RepID=UPI001AE84ECF|nr:C45 family peptidase [Neorhizobium galegae]MBP2563171.1 isopenicillin-N N-acyltransferase-like protein [Neorhizobium galegae]
MQSTTPGSPAVPHCPLIEISGPPRERGRQYGEQAADRIRLGVAHYSEQLAELRLDPATIQQIVLQFAGTLEVGAGDLLEEIRGIAEGADVDFTDAMLLNARTEILKIAQRRSAGLPDFIEPDGCTGVIVQPKATRDGQLIHAQDWDWKKECAETAVVLRVLRDDGPDILTFTEAGGLARAGFNSAGISITGNYLESDRDYRQLGMPLAVIRRRALEQQHYALAIRVVHATAKSASNNMMLAQATGVALDFECVPDETFVLEPVDGLLCHANHFRSPVAQTKIVDRGIACTPDSLFRDIRVHDLLAPKIGQIGVDDVKAALFDDFDSPWSVCRPPRKNIQDNLSATVAMIVMQPAAGIMEVAILPALNRNFQEYRLTPDGGASQKTQGISQGETV